MVLPQPLGPTTAIRRPGLSRRLTSASATGPPAAQPAATSHDRQLVRPGRQRASGVTGSGTGSGRSSNAMHAAQRRGTEAEPVGRLGQPGRRRRRRPAASARARPASSSGSPCRTPERRARARHTTRRRATMSALPTPTPAAARPCAAVSRRSVSRSAVEPVRGQAVGDEVGQPVQQVHDVDGELGPQRRRPRLRPTGHRPLHQRHRRSRPRPGWPRARAAPAGRIAPSSTAVAVPASTAAAYGSSTRTRRSRQASTSEAKRCSASPRATALPGTCGISRANARTRRIDSTRRAASWPASRSPYRANPREIPKARTATTATPSSSTGGCWDARAMSQAAAAMSPIPHPAATVAAERGQDEPGQHRRASRSSRTRGLMGRAIASSEHDNAVGQRQHGRSVRDDQRRPAGRGPADRGHHPRLGLRVEVGGGLVEQQHRRVARQRPGQRDALPLPGRHAPPGLGQLRPRRRHRPGTAAASVAPTLSATVPVQSCGDCGSQATCASHASASSSRQVGPADPDRPAGRGDEAEQRARAPWTCRCRCGPVSATTSPGATVNVNSASAAASRSG